jgi:hypothetical protein
VPAAAAVLAALAESEWPVVPVFIADRGLNWSLVAQAFVFPGVMVDTADKLAGSLFDVLTLDELRRFVALARGAGVMVGLAGALRLQHLQSLARLAPDFAGFRSAVCSGDRGSALDGELLRALAERLHAPALASVAELPKDAALRRPFPAGI